MFKLTKSILKQINWYQDQIEYIESLPVSRLNSKLCDKRYKAKREINLLTKELVHEYKTLSPNR